MNTGFKILSILVISTITRVYASDCSGLLDNQTTQLRGSESCLMLGVGVSAHTDKYHDKYNQQSFPSWVYINEHFYIENTELGFFWVGHEEASYYYFASSHITYAIPDRGDNNSGLMQNLPKPEETLEGGLDFTFGGKWGEAQFRWQHDLDNKHNGYFIDSRYSTRFKLQDITLSLNAGITTFSKDYVNYHYGVEAQYATASRPYYSTNDSHKTYAGYAFSWDVGEKWTLYHSFEYSKNGKNIYNSPLVAKQYSSETNFILFYKF